MKKYEIARNRFVSMGLVGSMSLLLSVPLVAIEAPPPPPPLPSDIAKKEGGLLVTAATKIEKDHNAFMKILGQYTNEKDAQKRANMKLTLDNAADKLSESIDAIRRLTDRMKKDLSGNERSAEVKSMQDQVKRSKVIPRKEQSDLMEELRKRLNKMQEE